MNALNLLLLRLVLDQPKIGINSQSKDFAWQINLLCSGSVLNPVTASTEEIQSVVFILQNREEIPPFSFSDISNVWIEEGSGAGRIQFRKMREAFRIGKGLAEILIEFKDLGYWSPDFSFSVELVASKDSQDYLKGIQKRLDFLNPQYPNFLEIDRLNSEKDRLVREHHYEEAANFRDKLVAFKDQMGDIALLYRQEFGS
ncbi:MAG: UvrB/UvrC motif-containing protein [Candidatus Pacebacteria bacterium]|nr:UvrB/UvrC motif-containing protein [Candidatus Paceibacterota bacterium]